MLTVSVFYALELPLLEFNESNLIDDGITFLDSFRSEAYKHFNKISRIDEKSDLDIKNNIQKMYFAFEMIFPIILYRT